MERDRLNHIVRQYRKMAEDERTEEMSDARLLEQFVRHQDETAFTLLVRRHGSMVLAACNRILNNTHAAEDAFQATFSVLARKAGSIQHRGLLAGWLYGVATRTALHARTERHRWPSDLGLEEIPGRAEDPSDVVARSEVCAILDEAIRGLPTTYRLPVVLCYLQGLTYDQAAQELGWPTGTVSGRLARAREMLRWVLSGRGVALSGAAIGGLLSENAHGVEMDLSKAAQVSAKALTHKGMSSGASYLTQTMMRSMMMTKVKVGLVAFLLISTLGMGGTGPGVNPGERTTSEPPLKEKQPKGEAKEPKIDELAERIRQLKQEQEKAQAQLEQMLKERGEKTREEAFSKLGEEINKLRTALEHDLEKRIAVERFLMDFIRLRHALADKKDGSRFPVVGRVLKVLPPTFTEGTDILVSLGREDGLSDRVRSRLVVYRLHPNPEKIGEASIREIGNQSVRAYYRPRGELAEVRVGDVVIMEDIGARGDPSLPEILTQQLKKLDAAR